MKIPTRIYTNNERAKRLIGFGKKILFKLEEDLAFRKLPTGSDSIKLSDGSIIKAFVSYSITVIKIVSPSFAGAKKKKQEKCKCGKYFSEGVVKSFIEIPGFVKPTRMYTVDVCQANNTQITVSICVAHDFHEYSVGERVWCSLDIREAIPCYPFFTGAESNAEYYAFATPWGCLGEERGFTYVSCEDTSGNYDKSSLPLVVSENAKGPCETPLSLPDDEWQGIYPYMCSLAKDISSCYWLYKSLLNGFVKNEESLYTEYSMLTTIGGAIDPEKDYSVKWLFNLQIIPQ